MKNTIKNTMLYGFLTLFIAFISACQCETPAEPDTTAPTITNQVFSLTENAPTNTMVGKVNAGDNVGVTALHHHNRQ